MNILSAFTCHVSLTHLFKMQRFQPNQVQSLACSKDTCFVATTKTWFIPWPDKQNCAHSVCKVLCHQMFESLPCYVRIRSVLHGLPRQTVRSRWPSLVALCIKHMCPDSVLCTRYLCVHLTSTFVRFPACLAAIWVLLALRQSFSPRLKMKLFGTL